MEKFSKTLHGYNPDEVNEFLDEVIAKVEKMVESNRQKNEEILYLKNEDNIVLVMITKFLYNLIPTFILIISMISGVIG